MTKKHNQVTNWDGGNAKNEKISDTVPFCAIMPQGLHGFFINLELGINLGIRTKKLVRSQMPEKISIRREIEIRDLSTEKI